MPPLDQRHDVDPQFEILKRMTIEFADIKDVAAIAPFWIVNVPGFSFPFQPVKSLPLNSEVKPSYCTIRGVAQVTQDRGVWSFLAGCV
jgi:hypothetical protein